MWHLEEVSPASIRVVRLERVALKQKSCQIFAYFKWLKCWIHCHEKFHYTSMFVIGLTDKTVCNIYKKFLRIHSFKIQHRNCILNKFHLISSSDLPTIILKSSKFKSNYFLDRCLKYHISFLKLPKVLLMIQYCNAHHKLFWRVHLNFNHDINNLFQFPLQV